MSSYKHLINSEVQEACFKVLTVGLKEQHYFTHSVNYDMFLK